MKDNFRLLKVPEVAQITGLKPKTIREYVYRRAIPYIKLNGAVLFDPEEIMKWINQSKVKPIKRKACKDKEVRDEI